MCARTGRAKPLSRDERRAAILEAVIPLLLERGASVTTAEMADAAGIAEGTIFRAFPDKATLLHEAVTATMDPLPLREILRQIPPDAPFRDQLLAATTALMGYLERGAALMGILRGMPPTGSRSGPGSRRRALDSQALIVAELTTIMDRQRDRLAVTSGQAAAVLRGLVFANIHPWLAPAERMTAEQIVTVLLTGVLADEAAT
jgi:AcrR family transcriptional regulator